MQKKCAYRTAGTRCTNKWQKGPGTSDVARLAPPRGAGGRMGAALAF
eukprot:CAMPEP_0119476286 /NCGR_PEP_ID=MMETSP1344-20130328/6861_1 /TAXON_ID=236787 /ORGANISM="Florenciella parvula, Strain CCMP2471" /LENGTH=46 /DNA_ID= /DNA_START= /DNA_END= /DNA_ORIENTATION=